MRPHDLVVLLVGMLGIAGLLNEAARAAPGIRSSSRQESRDQLPPLPLERLAPQVRQEVQEVLQRPSLTTHGPVETFSCQPGMYFWLLDHPQQAALLWRQLGAKVVDIVDLGGSFLWRDEAGSEVHWEAVWRGTRERIWFAKGKVRPGRFWPLVSVRVVAILEHTQGWTSMGQSAIRQQIHLVLHADSRAVSLATKLLGASVPGMAKQYARQVGLFFGALAWYLDRNPNRGDALFRAAGVPRPIFESGVRKKDGLPRGYPIFRPPSSPLTEPPRPDIHSLPEQRFHP
jgi:hypothetical protein